MGNVLRGKTINCNVGKAAYRHAGKLYTREISCKGLWKKRDDAHLDLQE